MDLEQGFETDMAFSSPSPTRSSTLSQGSKAYSAFLPPRVRAQSFTGLLVRWLMWVAHDQDETGDSLPQSIQYEELLEVVNKGCSKIKVIFQTCT